MEQTESTQPVNQDAMVSDFKSSYAPEFIDNAPQNAGNNGSPATSGLDAWRYSASNQPPQPQQAVPASQPVTQQSTPVAPAGYDQMFLDESGKFSADKFFEYQSKVKIQPFVPPEPKFKPVDPLAQPQAPIDPAEKFWKEHKEYADSLKNGYYKAFNLQQQYMQAGHDPQTAMQLAQQQLDKEIGEHLHEREFKGRFQLESAEQSQYREAQEMERLSPVVNSNLAVVANEFGGQENLMKLLSTDGLGKEDLMHTFHLVNSGKQWESKEAYLKDVDKFWVNFAQNPDNIRRVAANAQARLAYNNIPHLGQTIRSRLEAEQAQRMQGVNAQTRTVTSNNTPPQRNPAMLDFSGYAPDIAE